MSLPQKPRMGGVLTSRPLLLKRPTRCLVGALAAVLAIIALALVILSGALRSGGGRKVSRPDSSAVRAVWAPASFESDSRESVERSVRRLADSGVNRIYVGVWNNGRAYFDSPTIRAYAGEGAIGQDLMRWYLDAAPEGMEVHAWLEYGVMACWGEVDGNPFAEATRSDGMLIGKYGVWHWLDPVRMAPMLRGMIGELHGRYGVDVQLDDHFGCPHALEVREICDGSRPIV